METSYKRIKLYISGMTCVNCQNKIEQGLKRKEGIVSANVNYCDGTADIVYNTEIIFLKEIISVIEDLDYKVLLKKDHQETVKNFFILIIIVFLYVILQLTGLLNLLAPSQLADTKMGYGMIFVIGLITSVHCIAMCGGINLSQCIPNSEYKETTSINALSTLRPALIYNLGRVLSYTVIGFILGIIGFIIGGSTEVGLSAILQGVLKIAAGSLMVIMGINMLGIFPWLRKFTIRMPGFLSKKIVKRKTQSNRPLIVGILNGFMPCGPLQSMWIVALASGNPFTGALSMFLFGLGTVPLMLGLGSVVSALGKKFTDKVMKIGAILVVVLGLAMLSQGGSLSGWISSDLLLVLIIAFCIAGAVLSIPVDKKIFKNLIKVASLVIIIGSFTLWSFRGSIIQNIPKTNSKTEIIDGIQVVNSDLESGSYPTITVQVDIPVKWIVNAPEGSINGCNYKVIIQDYNIEYTFQTGENIIEFTPTKTGTINYSCWMGMIYGKIFVTG